MTPTGLSIEHDPALAPEEVRWVGLRDARAGTLAWYAIVEPDLAPDLDFPRDCAP
jgi:hypothetical protein